MFEVRETGNPEVPLYFGEGLRRSLGNAAGCAGGGQMGCAGLSFAWMFLCVETQLVVKASNSQHLPRSVAPTAACVDSNVTQVRRWGWQIRYATVEG